ncbi:hypothetical protein Tco_0126714 [Tanacetum coccineum]
MSPGNVARDLSAESIAEPTTAGKMSADVARGHGGDGGGDDRPPSHHIATGCGGCLGNRGKGTRTRFGWQESGQAAYPPGDPEPWVKGHHG